MTPPKRHARLLRMPSELDAQLEAEAKAIGLSVHSYIVLCLSRRVRMRQRLPIKHVLAIHGTAGTMFVQWKERRGLNNAPASATTAPPVRQEHPPTRPGLP
jgi:hypothetical protein